MCFMQIESVLQIKNRSEPAKNRFSVALIMKFKFFSTYLALKFCLVLKLTCYLQQSFSCSFCHLWPAIWALMSIWYFLHVFQLWQFPLHQQIAISFKVKCRTFIMPETAENC